MPAGLKTSLTAKLQAALDTLQAGDIATACSKLLDFINAVGAQRGKKIPVDLADSLISSATELMNELGCAQLASTHLGNTDGRLPVFDFDSTPVWTYLLIKFVMGSML